MEHRDHWDRVYQTKCDAELSWYQAHPALSLSLMEAIRPPPRHVIDIGGGQSALAGELVARGIEQITVLDISSVAIERGRARLGPQANRVRWIVADVLESQELRECDLWHDRAVFHFLTDPEQRRRYVDLACRAIVPGGHAILATFAPTGPESCSGLPVCRFEAGTLASEFGAPFQMGNATTEAHATPWGRTQDFTYTVLKRM